MGWALCVCPGLREAVCATTLIAVGRVGDEKPPSIV